jgi:hypothetical protein
VIRGGSIIDAKISNFCHARLFDYNPTTGLLTVIHEGGDTFGPSHTESLRVMGHARGDGEATWMSASDGNTVGAGDSIEVSVTGSETVRIVWTRKDGDAVQTVASVDLGETGRPDEVRSAP